ncbi:TPA: phage gp6-like head-tail connector protein [Vibrio parahaemolyticus]|uniref:head-tail connector protein n=1 Tax=Vibrio parahaemolyticus TaxID=670 RepID=UPI00112073DE|nr:head-tail connector protein [Vibrio parahaemolyticus]TPA59397.1 phage gp6-like head-tail connector protein [Vibrio parahaemolyticus]HCE1301206.1 phage gp6-like head-tail connector protein [Vibrio parahaemolyticus]HCE1593092.1 phage gp6-like head-tail connector protein [Vibrio parahaemolyticus]HCG7785603.1 phage gp6-like head-tail connector protein [Vibrio parahaemolyticus]HCG8351310.1 phage gp6-like head-tail connector protein [Vibrio parahaemolyticus]
MSYSILNRAYEGVVTYGEAAAHLRVWDEEDRPYIESLIYAAVSSAESYMKRFIGETRVAFTLSSFSQRLPFPDPMEVYDVLYLDNEGKLQTVPITDYFLDRLRNRIVYTGSINQNEMQSIEVVATFGWGANKVPPSVKHAILMLVATLYEMREDATVGQGVTVTKVPVTHQYLLNPYRHYSV